MNDRGYSFVEILCVLAIVSILATVAIPKFRISDEMELDHTAMQLAADLRWLQQRSKNLVRGQTQFQHAPIELIPQMKILQGVGGGYSITLGTTTLKRHTFTRNIRIDGTYAAISFNNDGYINRPVTILLQQGTIYREVIVDRVGRIRVQ